MGDAGGDAVEGLGDEVVDGGSGSDVGGASGFLAAAILLGVWAACAAACGSAGKDGRRWVAAVIP